MSSKLIAGALAALALSATAANATVTLNFNEYIHGDSNPRTYASVESNGFKIVSDVSSKPLMNWNLTYFGNADPYGATMMTGGSQSHAVFSRIDGGLFTLNAIDLTDGFNTPTAGFIDFTYSDGVETFTEELQLDRIKGLQTFTFDKKDLLWFSFGTSGWAGGELQFDNVVLDAPITSAVPEPATWAMLILGFGGIGAAMRRRRAEGLAIA